MTGYNPGMVPTQGEFLAKSFADKGYSVICVSPQLNPLLRIADVFLVLWSKRRSIDIQILQVYSGRSFTITDLASILGKAFDHRLIMVLHGGNLPDFSRRHPGWVRRVLRRADRIIAPSAYLRRDLAWLGFNIQIISNALDLSPYPYRHRSKLEPNLLWMRAFHDIYNPAMALDVLARICLELPDSCLTMAGPDMGLREHIERSAKEKGLAESTSFPGFLDMAAKTQIVTNHDIYLNTNKIDNMPLSVLEMAAMGLPIVSTNVGGIPDLLTDGETGLLVPGDDVQAMTHAVLRLLNDPYLASRLSVNGRKLAERFSWPEVFPFWEQLLFQL